MLSEAAFLSPRSQFFTIRTDPKSANNMFIFSSGILACKRVCSRHCVYDNKPFAENLRKDLLRNSQKLVFINRYISYNIKLLACKRVCSRHCVYDNKPFAENLRKDLLRNSQKLVFINRYISYNIKLLERSALMIKT